MAENTPMSSSMKVSPELLTSLGEYSQAMKMVKSELRDLNAETRAMEKGGWGWMIPTEKRERISDLEIQLEQLNVAKLSQKAKQKLKQITDDSSRIVDRDWSEKQKRIRQAIRDERNSSVDSHVEPEGVIAGLGAAKRWSRGGITARELMQGTKAIENIGWKIYENSQKRVGGGAAERMIGIEMVKQGMNLSKGMVTLAGLTGPIALGVAAGLGAWQLGSMYYEREKAASASAAIPATLLNETLFADRFGQRYDEKFALDAMTGMGYAGRKAEASAYRASPYERLLHRLGFAPGDAILGRREEAQRVEYQRRIMAQRYGTGFAMATGQDEIRKKYSNEINRLVRREFLVTDRIVEGIRGFTPAGYALAEAIDYFYVDNKRYDATQRQIEAFQKKAMVTFELQRKNHDEIWNANPVNKLTETMTKTQLFAAASYQRTRALQWNKF